MKSETELWNKVKEDYPHLETDEEIADEMLATYSGQHGMQRLREECHNYKDGDTVLNRISAALDCFWKNVSNFFGIQYKGADEVADRVFYDLLNEVNPLVYTKKGVQKLSDRMILGQNKQSDTAMEEKKLDDHVQLYNELSKKLAAIMPKHGDGVYLASPLRMAEDSDKPVDINRVFHDLGKKSGEFVCANMFYHMNLSDMSDDNLRNLTKVFDEKLHTNHNVTEVKFNKATAAAKEAIHDRIVTPTARWFTDDQTKALKDYSAMFPADADTKELFTHLYEDVCKQEDVACKPDKWMSDTLEELNKLSEGITRDQFKGLHV